MNKINFSQKERRTIIILMIINVFALFVNYFNLSPKFNIGSYKNRTELFLFTDSKEKLLLSNPHKTYFKNGTSRMYQIRHTKHFWPFVKFYDKDKFSINRKRIRGIFADFDHTEFGVYTLIIFGFFIVKKLW